MSQTHCICLLHWAETVHFGGNEARWSFGGHVGVGVPIGGHVGAPIGGHVGSTVLSADGDHSFFALTALARHIVVHSVFGDADWEDPLRLIALSTNWNDPLFGRILIGDRNL